MELSQFGAVKLAEPGQFVPEGALTFSVLPEAGLWIKYCAPGRKTGTHADSVAGRGLSTSAQYLPKLCISSNLDWGMGLCLQDPLTHQLHPLVFCLPAFSELMHRVTGGDHFPCVPSTGPHPVSEWELWAQLAGGKRLGAGDQLCPLGKEALLRWRWGRLGGSAGWHVGRCQSRACVRGWSSAANRFGDWVFAWAGEESRSERAGRATTGLSPRGVRPVIQGTSGTSRQGPLHIRAGDFSSLILA